MFCWAEWSAKQSWLRLIVTVIIFSTLGACHRRPSESLTLSASTSIVARVDGTEILLTDLRAEAARRGRNPLSLQDVSALLDECIRSHLILSEVHRTGFDQSAELKEKWEQFVVGRYLEQQKQVLVAEAASDEECLAWYRHNMDRFRLPERANLAIVYIRVPSMADPQRREEARSVAEELRSSAEAEASQTPHFGGIALDYSDDQASRYKGGDVGWLTRKEAESAWSRPVAEVAFGLTETGQISPVIETGTGLYLFKLIKRTAADIRSLAEVREFVAQQAMQEKLHQRREALYADLRARSAVEINESLLEHLRKSDALNSSAEPPQLPAQ